MPRARDCLGAQVAAAALPAHLWQRPGRGQLSQLRRLTAAFPLLRALACDYERGRALDARTMRRTMGLLARATPTLAAVRLRGMVDAGAWPALAEGLAPLAPQLVALDLVDACWPDPASMASLTGSLSRLQRLRLHSSVFSRLAAAHAARDRGDGAPARAVAGARRGAARPAAGRAARPPRCPRRSRLRSPAWAASRPPPSSNVAPRTRHRPSPHAPPPPRASAPSTAPRRRPLALDPLTRLSRLAVLDLEYTGVWGG